jgi:phosphopantetheinyl transferase
MFLVFTNKKKQNKEKKVKSKKNRKKNKIEPIVNKRHKTMFFGTIIGRLGLRYRVTRFSTPAFCLFGKGIFYMQGMCILFNLTHSKL